MLLLFVGVSMQAQSIASKQMDERFNDGTKFPRGWFGEGWKVENGKAKAKATEDSGNSGFPGMGGGTGTQPSTNPSTTPSMNGMPGMGSMFGGNRIRTYLLTPPVSVKEGEDMVFSARKTNGDDDGKGGGMGFNFDLKAIMGFTDTLFVVERSVYGKNQWVRVADFTSTLTDKFQTLTVSDTPKGEYRFRFISYVDAEIDSVAGFHIDNEAPDLLVTVDSLHTHFVDYCVCAKDSTKEFIVINTGTSTLKVNISSSIPELFSIDQSKLSIAAGDSAKLNVTFHYNKGTIGKNEAMINFKPEDTRLNGASITVASVITNPGAWVVNFNDNKLPVGCFGEGFVVKEGVATHYNPAGGGMAAMAAIFGGGGASDWFMTPPLTIRDVNDAVIFSLKNGDGSYKGPISAKDADNKNIYCLLADGSWVRFTSEADANASLNAFRGYFLSDAPIDQPAGTRGVDKGSNRFQTLFWSNMTDGSLPGALDIHYDADIPIPLLTGDANGDGVVNGKDVEAIAQHIMGELPEGDLFSKKNADINGDEKIDATDIVQLVNRVNQ